MLRMKRRIRRIYQIVILAIIVYSLYNFYNRWSSISNPASVKINTEELTGVAGGFNAETEEYLEETIQQNEHERIFEFTNSLKVVKENSFSETLSETKPVNDKEDFIFGAEDVKFRLNEVEKYQLISEDIFRSFPNYQNSTKYLIYHCSDKCGGFADRLKGIVFVYIMSVLTHRKFAINMTSPCELGRVLRPNLLDWRTPDMSKFTEKTYKIYDYFENNNAYSIDYERFDLDPIKMFDVDVAAVRANQDWTRIFRNLSVTSDRFPQLYQYHSSEILKIVYNGLFRPSTELQDQVDTFFANEVNGSKLACLHARIGEEKHQRYTENQMMTPLLFLKQYDSRDNYKILVATDSDRIKMISKHLFRHFVDTDGPIMHIDYINISSAENLNRNEAGFMRTMLDHMILHRCDKLILTASGFGVTAGSIRHTSHGLYVYMRDNAVMATTREILRETFQWRCIKRSWDSTEKDFFASICDS